MYRNSGCKPLIQLSPLTRPRGPAAAGGRTCLNRRARPWRGWRTAQPPGIESY
ncbi:hypothetical protein [Lysobacter gummosus]|uniref:hypothetical protein n=1 Tax=Lysobacter gummosus TaxID=262324 RepID=UPI0036308EFA